ncbi:MAG: hypothetical protein P4L50_18705 [Anaerolineaceae bacterium]|nr:hypothetical protein [Anaerolineaceae bacterium]
MKIDDRKPSLNLLILLLALLALFIEMGVELARLGWLAPSFQGQASLSYDPILISGFLGTLIFLERAITRKQNWIYTAPILSGFGTLMLILFPGSLAGLVMVSLASLAAVGVLTVNLRQEGHVYTITMGLGALAWFTGNLLWLHGWSLQRVIFWWAAFLILAISGERLELSRKVRRPSMFQYQLLGLTTCILLGGVVLTGQDQSLGAPLAGFGMIALAAWLVRYDAARSNVNNPSSLTRYMATCVLVGYCWLAAGGLISLYYSSISASLFFDGIFYSIFLGFVFSMIFGQTPNVLQTVLGLPLKFMKLFYLPLGLLHASLLLWIGSDMASWQPGVHWGGLINQLAILLFLGMMFLAFRRAVLKSELAGSM